MPSLAAQFLVLTLGECGALSLSDHQRKSNDPFAATGNG
jgi:hypothetical protein